VTSENADDPDALREMTRDQLVELGGERDEVHVVKTPRAPFAGTKDARWAERSVAAWFALSMLFAVAFVACFVFWPDDYVVPGEPGYGWYAWNTPILGVTFGGTVLALGIGVIAYVKRFFPEETAVQRHSPGPSEPVDRATAVARFAEAGEDTGIARRGLVRRAVLGAAGLAGVAAVVLPLGTFVRNPWRGGEDAALWVTGWRGAPGETVYLRVVTSEPSEIVRVRPGDLAPGAMMAVVPFRESERGDEEALLAAERATDTPVMLIRLPQDTRFTPQPGREDFAYGEYVAFSRICTHLGCPASLYDTQNNTALCPCHQSAFSIAEGAKPVFGPATRALPQLPITVDEEGWFVATGDFPEPVGPAFWEIRSR
jgi:ubiquinol-cytochrome c reductase iron-sulfur subunit